MYCNKSIRRILVIALSLVLALGSSGLSSSFAAKKEEKKKETLEEKQQKKEKELKKNKKNKKKADKNKDVDEEDEETPYEELTDEEKDALDYQLQRAMGMVVAMSKMQSRQNMTPTDVLDGEKDK